MDRKWVLLTKLWVKTSDILRCVHAQDGTLTTVLRCETRNLGSTWNMDRSNSKFELGRKLWWKKWIYCIKTRWNKNCGVIVWNQKKQQGTNWNMDQSRLRSWTENLVLQVVMLSMFGDRKLEYTFGRFQRYFNSDGHSCMYRLCFQTPQRLHWLSNERERKRERKRERGRKMWQKN